MVCVVTVTEEEDTELRSSLIVDEDDNFLVVVDLRIPFYLDIVLVVLPSSPSTAASKVWAVWK